MEDRWDATINFTSDYYHSKKEMMAAIVRNIKGMSIGRMMINGLDRDEYEVTLVKVVIKKK